jgi:hypothetical protein
MKIAIIATVVASSHHGEYPSCAYADRATIRECRRRMRTLARSRPASPAQPDGPATALEKSRQCAIVDQFAANRFDAAASSNARVSTSMQPPAAAAVVRSRRFTHANGYSI